MRRSNVRGSGRGNRPLPSFKRRPFVATIAALVVGAAVVATAAAGHPVLRPGESRPAELQQYTLTVPTEREVPTSEIVLKVPTGITFFLVEEVPGWERRIVKRNGLVDEVHWTGGEIPPDSYAVFHFIARNPVQEGDLVWRVLQQYAGGEVVRWIGESGTETPAARTVISETAVPIDVLDVVSGGGGPSGGQTPGTDGEGAVDENSGGDTRDGLTLGVAIGGAVAGVLALAFALAAWRRSRSAGRRTSPA